MFLLWVNTQRKGSTMYRSLVRLSLAAALLAAAPFAQAIVFAINEGMTYRVSNDEIRGRYAAIAADLSKLLRQPVTIEPVGDYPSLRAGLAAKRYDLAMVHPAHLSIQAIKESATLLWLNLYISISELLLPDFFLRLDILLLIVSVSYIPADSCNIIAATAFYLGLLIAIFGSDSFIFSSFL